MEFSVSELALGPASPDEGLDAVAAAGFDRISLDAAWRSAWPLVDPASRAALRARLDARGLGVDWIHAPFVRPHLYSDDEGLRAYSLAALCGLLERSAELGARAFVVHVFFEHLDPEIDSSVARDRITECFAQLVETGDRVGVRVAAENLIHDDTHGVVEHALETIPRLAFCLDTGHAHLTGTWSRWLPRFDDRLVATHFHDNRGERDDHLPPGEGGIDWRFVCRLLSDSAYDGVWGLEVLGRCPSEEEETGAPPPAETLADLRRRIGRVAEGRAPVPPAREDA